MLTSKKAVHVLGSAGVASVLSMMQGCATHIVGRLCSDCPESVAGASSSARRTDGTKFYAVERPLSQEVNMKRLASVAIANFALTALVLSVTACGSVPADARKSEPSRVERPARAERPPAWPALSDPSAPPATFEPVPPPDTKATCDACGGLWDIHGIAEIESCVCATKDGGRDCTDGNQCEGVCILEEGAALQIVEPGETARGYYVGQCSNFDTIFGCYRIIPSGTVAQGAHGVDAGFEDVCVD